MFYETLGAKAGRKYPTHVVYDFFGHQLVLHKVKKGEHGTDEEPKMYPRHFGIIFDSELRFRDLAEASMIKFPKSLIYQPIFLRNPGKPEEHMTFFLKDLSNNLIEFKYYKNKESLF